MHGSYTQHRENKEQEKANDAFKGTYDPIPKPARPGDPNGRPYKDIKLDRSRAQYWLGVGAQPSDTCWRLLSMVRHFILAGFGRADAWECGGSVMVITTSSRRSWRMVDAD